ncbi:hypothetical protein [Agrobacterium salinitolerans]|uniref:EF-hand domain-containing protein n=1 Tax=Agrobacterium salinitolerans TaxID=1183413 RepID=A0A9X3KKF4_9HYPH|nr:hypothetical protein [Agrobacterium salinitolerans]MCZ7936335.1 hypothetical protein [Agrobacterium salinitolerans]
MLNFIRNLYNLVFFFRSRLDNLVLGLTLSVPLLLFVIYVSTVKQTIARDGDCPLIIDLNQNGRIDITGHTQSREKLYTVFSVGKYIDFDINGDGVLDEIDWVMPNTDAFILDLRKGMPPRDIDGSWFFGDSIDGSVENGFIRIKEIDTDGNGVINGEELAVVGFWVDNGDGKFEQSEFRSVVDLQVTLIETSSEEEDIGYGVTTIKGSLESDLLGIVRVEDVWFLDSSQVAPQDNAFASYIRY